MNPEQQPGPVQPPAPPPSEQEAGWGAPPPPPEQRRRWTPRRIAVAVAIAVGIAAAGGVAIYAASGTADGGGMGGGAPGGGRMFVGGPMSELEHGEFQNGEVTAISDTSITAKSEDGYERTYTIDDETQLGGEIAEGDDVMIMATVDGDTATAASVMEQGDMGGGPRNGGPGNGGGSPPADDN